MKLLPAFLCLAFQLVRSHGRVVIASHTIDDAHPSNICPAGSSKPNDFSQMIDGTMTSIAGISTIPFHGTAVSVFFGTLHKFGVTFQLDGEQVGHFEQKATNPAVGQILGYRNDSLPNVGHQLQLISEQGALVDFDGIIFTDEEDIIDSDPPRATISSSSPHSATGSASDTNFPSSGSQAVTASGVKSSFLSSSSPTQSSAINTDSQSRTLPSSQSIASPSHLPSSVPVLSTKRFPVVAVAVGVTSGLLFLVALVIIVHRLRRQAQHLQNIAVEQPFSLLEEKSPSQDSPTPSRMAQRLRRIESSIEALMSILRRPSSRRDRSTRSEPPAYSDTAST
ncbi:hypothetical protein C8R43DRAFT_1105547 [Mycena crocata]|nr:hypothetical protein C8R43DRAFT_1105547 [Mycena crocata]